MEYNIRDKYIVKQPVAGPSFADDDDEAPDGAMNDDNRESSTATKSGKPKSVDSPTPTIDKYAIDLSKAASEGRLDPVVGRDREIERVAQILGRRKKNNPVLIGEPGVGK